MIGRFPPFLERSNFNAYFRQVRLFWLSLRESNTWPWLVGGEFAHGDRKLSPPIPGVENDPFQMAELPSWLTSMGGPILTTETKWDPILQVQRVASMVANG